MALSRTAIRAARIAREIYASLPWGYRVAGLLVKLAMSTQQTFGKYAYWKFVLADVKGLPDINGAPASSLKDKVDGPRGDSKLPANYGAQFGQKVYRTALAKMGNPELVEDAMSSVMMRMVSGQLKINEGVTLAEAESYVLTSVLNARKDLHRKDKRRGPQDSLVDDETGAALDLEDPAAFKMVENALSAREMDALLRDVGRVHPKAPEWVEAMLEGVAKRELAVQWDTTPNYITNWENRYLDKVKAVVKDYLKDAA